MCELVKESVKVATQESVRQRRPLVFLVEADSGLRQSIGKGLRDQGYPVSEAGSVDELEMDLTFAYLNGSESNLDALIVPGAEGPEQDEHAIARLLQRQSWRLPLLHSLRLNGPLSLAAVCDAIAAFVHVPARYTPGTNGATG
jgi:hypothetical protein